MRSSPRAGTSSGRTRSPPATAHRRSSAAEAPFTDGYEMSALSTTNGALRWSNFGAIPETARPSAQTASSTAQPGTATCGPTTPPADSRSGARRWRAGSLPAPSSSTAVCTSARRKPAGTTALLLRIARVELGSMAQSTFAVLRPLVPCATGYSETMEAANAFRHQARFYAGEADFVDGALRFIRDGLAAGEPVMVAVRQPKIELLESALNGDGGRVIFRDMADVGSNPARIIPAWQQFLDDHARGAIRGIGEPIWPGRDRADLIEAHVHEALINRAFASAAGFLLECPYDESALSPEVIAIARRTHPHHDSAGDVCADVESLDTLAWDELSPVPADATRLPFGRGDLGRVRAMAASAARSLGFGERAVNDVRLAVTELAANAVRHGGGRGVLGVWREPSRLCCQVDDRGRIVDPLVGRRLPEPGRPDGRGLWLANQVCDLVQIRSNRAGTSVRVHVKIGANERDRSPDTPRDDPS